jgi:two-component system, OmpR family, sensor histidine kinase BaeS
VTRDPDPPTRDPRLSARGLPSLRWTLLAVAVVAVTMAVIVVSVATSAMVLSAAEYRFVLFALVAGAALGLVAALAVAGPLRSDLRRLAAVAGTVADGDLEVRTGVRRRDEVGDLAAAVDRMVEQLAALEAARAADDAARRALFTAVGHDLRTPLASLQAATEALQDGVAADPDRYLRSMVADVRSLRGMVDDLFVLAQLEAGALHLEAIALDLAEVVDGAVEATEPLARRRGVEVAATLDGVVPVVGDARALDRVVRNLLDNAVRHAPAGSVVTATVSVGDDGAEVRVHDDGEGFPDDFADLAFDPFSRADAARERHAGGAGLGLAIVRELIQAHGGDVHISSGPGATVVVRLPIGRSHDAEPGA